MTNNVLSLDQFNNFDFRELPIGVYITSLDGQFIECNKTLRSMLELPVEGSINASIRDFYAEASDRETFINKANTLASQGKYFDLEVVHLIVHNRDMYVEDYCKIMHNHEGHVIGFVGCMVDITNDFLSRKREKELQQRVEELRFDIGSILHANTTTLVMVKQTLDAIVEALEPNPFRDISVPKAEEVESMLTDYAGKLAGAIERSAQSADEERLLQALPQTHWIKLLNYVSFLNEFKERIPTPELYSGTLRKLANDVGQILSNIVPGNIPRETTRELQNAAWHLERITNLIEVLETRASVIQMDYTIHSLREYITSDARGDPILDHKVIRVRSLIEDCVRRLAEYARSLQIDIDHRDIVDSYITVNEREMTRALSNLLHNAIKYSWQRDPKQGKPAWVSIRTKVDGQDIHIEFENFGVPIKREEIEMGKIFELGYRGELSKDRGRLGTGIGLTDAHHVAESHGGLITVESHPARVSDYKDPNYYVQPFLTRVTMILPLAKEQLNK
ncbi:MAG TPA: PAS domain-containing sensor histidine kinase [Anaerolineales bacterium]|nr:PAS domain-containing sensor histidine kinase [Anaerolineales bacterium]